MQYHLDYKVPKPKMHDDHRLTLIVVRTKSFFDPLRIIVAGPIRPVQDPW
jgi:hypothetical protein